MSGTVIGVPVHRSWYIIFESAKANSNEAFYKALLIKCWW